MASDLIIRIDLDSAVPAYRQIVDAIRTLMVEGKLKPGDQLPTVRQLAVDLTVHHNTVAEAYRQLADEGWLELRRRRGAVVQDRKAPKATAEATIRFDQRLRELLAVARMEGMKPKDIATILERISRNIMEIQS
jgi:DNA-binding transcriptional regulator YhcF (GntR family)